MQYQCPEIVLAYFFVMIIDRIRNNSACLARFIIVKQPYLAVILPTKIKWHKNQNTGVAGTANIMAALWPERCKGMVSVSGYLVGNQ